jgi:hypothetical protein
MESDGDGVGWGGVDDWRGWNAAAAQLSFGVVEGKERGMTAAQRSAEGGLVRCALLLPAFVKAEKVATGTMQNVPLHGNTQTVASL